MHFFKKMKVRKVSRSFSGLSIYGQGGHKERVNEGEYSGCILYPYMKIEE
jgi:hypothetical protein